MEERQVECFSAGPEVGAPVIHAVRPDALPAFLAGLPPLQAAYLQAGGFAARAGEIVLLPGAAGLSGAVLGLGESGRPHLFGALPPILPPGTVWSLSDAIDDRGAAVLGFGLGAYRFDRFKSRPPAPGPRLVLPAGLDVAPILSAIRATWLVRDLVNTPANLLGPAELADTARHTCQALGAHAIVIAGAELGERYPTIHAVGAGSARPPCVVLATWQGTERQAAAPLISLCGKGVCFDSGGYDLKPSAGMLRMKKDMAGAAIALGLARMIMEANLPVRLELRLGCVENMVSGSAMRPLDLIRTRRGLTVEIGNTDAEGRLVLCDLLAEASEAEPAALLDFATLTGAARTALGPELPAMFSNNEILAGHLLQAGNTVHDPVWRLPLWEGYNSWLESGAGDLNNVSDRAQAGAIVAALFLQRFVSPGIPWAHFDVYGWTDAAGPGAPAGGEAQAMRSAFVGLTKLVRAHNDRNIGR
jgi:leucyl aminopeptidase